MTGPGWTDGVENRSMIAVTTHDSHEPFRQHGSSAMTDMDRRRASLLDFVNFTLATFNAIGDMISPQEAGDAWLREWQRIEALIAESPRLQNEKRHEDNEKSATRSSPSRQTGEGDLASAMQVDPPSARNEER
jgi:hypothetical protein